MPEADKLACRCCGWRIGIQSRREDIRLDNPDFASGIVREERRKVRAGNFASPHDSRMVNIGGVVDPFPVRKVSGRIADNDEMVAGSVIEFGSDGGSRRVISMTQTVRVARARNIVENAGGHHKNSACDDDSGPSNADRTAGKFPAPHIAKSLNENDDERA